AAADGARSLTYGELAARVSRLAGVLAARGGGRGARGAILSENRVEYLELTLAAAHVGAVAACQNWRLAPAELRHCIDLVQPALIFASPRHAPQLTAAATTSAGR